MLTRLLKQAGAGTGAAAAVPAAAETLAAAGPWLRTHRAAAPVCAQAIGGV